MIRRGVPPAAVLLGLLVVSSAALFVPVLKGYWLADDFDWVKDFHGYPWSDVPRLFLADWSRAAAQEYRPLWAASFIVDLRVWGLDPMALHRTSLGLHLVACLLVWLLAASVPGADRRAAPLAAAFFALAPLHAEPVCWVSARGHLLAPIFILGAVLLFRRFEQRGGRLTYVASFGCALAAFATQEIAAALAPLLLLRDVLDAPRRDRAWLRRLIALHAPFWAALAAYLAFRLLRFGMLGRPDTFASIPRLVRAEFGAMRVLWLSPITFAVLPGGPAARLVKAVLCLLAAATLLAPLSAGSARGRPDYARGLIYFAGLWPLVCTGVLFGAASQRHFYLATVGPAIALGLAGSRLLACGPAVARAAAVTLALLLAQSGLALASSVAPYAQNGRLSRQIAREVDLALDAAARDPKSVTVIIPEFPERRAVFWDYFYPVALEPPFRSVPPPKAVLPSFTTCHCLPEEWRAQNAVVLARLKRGGVSRVHVVIWEAGRSKFVTRSLSPEEFWEKGYAAATGPISQPGSSEARPDRGEDRDARLTYTGRSRFR
ncbi:MAG: hypothetical protein ACM3SU_06780 [Acidobacteriota bacterium]